MKAYAVVLSLATLAVAQMNGGAAPVPPPAPAAGDTPACAEAKILAGGIALNIEVQQQEVNGVNAVMQALQANPPNPQQFQTAKSNLLSFVSDGIQVRQANQLIAPSGNMATQGLAVVSDRNLFQPMNTRINLKSRSPTPSSLSCKRLLVSPATPHKICPSSSHS